MEEILAVLTYFTFPPEKSKFVKTHFMAVPVLDNEFMQYWSKLTVTEKESLLSVAKQYVQLKSEDADNLRKQLVMEERASYLKGEGKSFSWDEVKDMAINNLPHPAIVVNLK